MASNDNTEWYRLLFEKEQWSEEERRRLLEYLDEGEDEELRRLMEERFRQDGVGAPTHSEAEGRLLALIHEKIRPPGKRVRLYTWTKWAVAAAIVLIAGRLLFKTTQPKPDKKPVLVAADRPPGTQAATLTLGDGRTITLDSAADGNLARQGNTQIVKRNGQIAYTGKGSDAPPVWNTITTARGNQYSLVLPDGSKVWLNAASSVRFPTAFTGGERKVEITGEAYFDIAQQPANPFKVIARGGEVDVLGTHFNINAYDDEPAVRTTLLEGAVKVRQGASETELHPGQQAVCANGKITLIKHVDTDQATAWKDGFFYFDNTDLHTLMRQVSRWYDVEISFKGDVSDDGFSGKISRNVPLSKLLKVLEQYDIHFDVAGNKITVSGQRKSQ